MDKEIKIRVESKMTWQYYVSVFLLRIKFYKLCFWLFSESNIIEIKIGNKRGEKIKLGDVFMNDIITREGKSFGG